VTETALTVPQVAKRLQVCAATVRAEIERGHLRARRVGRLYRIPAGALEEYLCQNGECAGSGMCGPSGTKEADQEYQEGPDKRLPPRGD